MAVNLFPAMYRGSCGRCDCAIEEGDLIAYHDDQSKPCCINCIRELNAPPVCKECNLAHKGECW